MAKILLKKLIASLKTVAPVALVIMIMQLFSIIQLSSREIVAFLVITIVIIVGIALFNLGADMSMTPMGEKIGVGLSKTGKMPILIITILILGLLITIAEPDLSVLSNQLKDNINPILLVVFVGIGVALLLMVGVLKIVYKVPLSGILIFFYMCAFSLVALAILLNKSGFIAIAFDSGGVTTGPITVPFIMALGIGIASTLNGKRNSDGSFGLISLCSIGPIIAVLFLGLFSNKDLSYTVKADSYALSDDLVKEFFSELLNSMKEVSIALGLIVIVFLILQLVYLKISKKRLIHIGLGTIFTFFGLILFLTAVKVGYLPIGYKIGQNLASINKTESIIIAFIIGAVVVLAEPAIGILTEQVNDITEGRVTKLSMYIALSIGVGLSIALSFIRIYFDFSILYFIIPGYIIALGLSFFVPKIYTAIAFDSGGVASGPLTSSFILPMAIGLCSAVGHNVALDAFGIVAMVALAPLIAIQLLGFKAVVTNKVKRDIAYKKIISIDDEQIINF